MTESMLSVINFTEQRNFNIGLDSLQIA